jgi:hypothetical protein
MTVSTIRILAVLILLAAAGFAGCTSQETVVSGEEREAVLAYAEPIAENLLMGFNGNDYARYSKHFSREMRQSLTEEVFQKNRDLIVSKIGLYVSRDSPVVTETGDHIAVNYRAAFEEEEGVLVRVVFLKGDDKHEVRGLWFNSPKLRA